MSRDIIGLMNGSSFALANLLHYLSIAISQLRTKEVMMAPISKRGEPLSDRESTLNLQVRACT